MTPPENEGISHISTVKITAPTPQRTAVSIPAFRHSLRASTEVRVTELICMTVYNTNVHLAACQRRSCAA